MRTLIRLLLTALASAVTCVLFWAILYPFRVDLIGGTRAEAAAFIAVVGFVTTLGCAFIGLVAGLLKAGPGRGALVAFLVTLCFVALWVIPGVFEGRGNIVLRESTLVWRFFGIPAVLSGLAGGLVSRRLLRTARKEPSFVDSPQPL